MQFTLQEALFLPQLKMFTKEIKAISDRRSRDA